MNEYSDMSFALQTPLHLAVMTDSSDIVRRLLEAGASPNAADRRGQTCFHIAVNNRTTNCLKTLIDSCKRPPEVNAMSYDGMQHARTSTSCRYGRRIWGVLGGWLHLSFPSYEERLCPDFRREGALLGGVRLFVRPSVACLDLTQQRKCPGSPKLAWGKPIWLATSEPI